MFPFNVSFLFVLATKTGNTWSFMFPYDSRSRGNFLFSPLPTRDWETLLNTLFVQLRHPPVELVLPNQWLRS